MASGIQSLAHQVWISSLCVNSRSGMWGGAPAAKRFYVFQSEKPVFLLICRMKPEIVNWISWFSSETQTIQGNVYFEVCQPSKNYILPLIYFTSLGTMTPWPLDLRLPGTNTDASMHNWFTVRSTRSLLLCQILYPRCYCPRVGGIGEIIFSLMHL